MAYFNVGAPVPKFVDFISLTPSAVPANSVSVETFTVNNIPIFNVDSNVYVTAPSGFNAGLLVLESKFTSNGVLQISFDNVTNASIAPAATSFKVLVF